MKPETLIDMAAEAANDAARLTAEIAPVSLNRDATAALLLAARRLTCAAQELDNQAAGFPEPHVG